MNIEDLKNCGNCEHHIYHDYECEDLEDEFDQIAHKEFCKFDSEFVFKVKAHNYCKNWEFNNFSLSNRKLIVASGG